MPIPLRADFDAPCLRAIARGTKDAAQTRRLLALAAVYDGARRTEAAAIGGVTLQIVRDWVMRPSAPHDQRTASTYIFGAICPKDGKGAALVLPRCNIAAMKPASGRDRDGGGVGGTRRAPPRPGRMAPVRQAHRAAEHHPPPAAAQMP